MMSAAVNRIGIDRACEPDANPFNLILNRNAAVFLRQDSKQLMKSVSMYVLIPY